MYVILFYIILIIFSWSYKEEKEKLLGSLKQFEKWISNFALMDKIIAFYAGRKEPTFRF